MRIDKFFPLPPIADGKAAAEAEVLQKRCLELGQYVNIVMPDCLEKSAAVEHLKETYEWALAAILDKRGCRRG